MAQFFVKNKHVQTIDNVHDVLRGIRATLAFQGLKLYYFALDETQRIPRTIEVGGLVQDHAEGLFFEDKTHVTLLHM